MELSRPWRVIGHSLLLLASLAVLVPMVFVVGTAFKPPPEVFRLQPWPDAPTIANFAAVLLDTPFLTFFINSAGTTVLRVAGQVVVAVLTAYAFARWRFPGRDLVFAIVLGAMMIPHQLTMIPNYILITRLDWFDTWTALIVPHLAMPFGVFLLRQHFLAFPPELFDAAEMDGAGSLRTLWSVVLPTMSAPLAALTIVLFIDTWNEYFWPLLVTSSPASQTLQIGLRRFLEEDYANYAGLMAGVTLASLPALAVFFALQRRVIHAFMQSGLKG